MVVKDLLSESDSCTINNIKNELADKVISVTHADLGLLDGVAGNLIFIYKLALFNDSDSYEVFSREFDNLINKIGTRELNLSLNNGYSGIGWAVEYFNQKQQEYDSDFCEVFDNILINSTHKEWEGEIEALFGLAGIAVYASRRMKQKQAFELYNNVIDLFTNLAISHSENTISWLNPKGSLFNSEDGVAEYNLGLAHGVPGIISSLIPALESKELTPKVTPLIVGACNWLIENKMPEVPGVCQFSYNTKKPVPARLGWCYGDLTIALTFVRAGKALKIPAYIDFAKELAVQASRRTNDDELVKDAGICHGTVGLALIFSILYKEFLEESLLQASYYWLQQTIRLYEANGLEGLNCFFGGEYIEKTGLLTGYSGIGLALISIVENDYDWCDCLLM